MFNGRPVDQSLSPFINQIFAAIVKDQPFKSPCPSSSSKWSTETVIEVLRSIPRYLFRSPRSIGCQKGFRHRTPLKQRSLKFEAFKAQNGSLILGPAAYRDEARVNIGLKKAVEFFDWIESEFGFHHNELTCKVMALVLAKGNSLRPLWEFLNQQSKKGRVTTATVTCVIKVLGEEGLVNEALTAFYRMKKFHCKPDVLAYNTITYALCRVGNFKKAKLLLQQMELPGFQCPPDTFTYTILISSYCKHALETGCRKAARWRLWKANHFLRIMLFKGFVPDVVTYNCLINGCCKTYRIGRALELFDDMLKRGCLPNRVTYDSFIRYYSSVNETEKAIEMMRRMDKHGHGTPTTSSYTSIIHSLCERGRILEARDYLIELVNRGSIPRSYTYNVIQSALNSIGARDSLNLQLCEKIEEGMQRRISVVKKVKPILS